MKSITPNREIIRRICILNGGSTCYISYSTENNFIEILADIKISNLSHFEKELKEWTGINYKVYSTENNTGATSKHIQEKILPIDY